MSMLYFIKSSLVVAVLVVWGAATAAGQSLTGNVGSAGITQGDQSAELRLGIDSDGNAGGRVHYDYAFAEWYKLRLIGAFSQPDGEDWSFSALTVENWLQWSEEAGDGTGFHGGLRLAYGFADDGGPDEAQARLTLTDKFGEGWEWRSNLIGELEAGSGSRGGLALQARAQISRAGQGAVLGTGSWRVGVEYFGELGNTRDIPGFDDQAHQIGPVAKLSWPGGVYVQTAVRFGVTDGADDTMAKLFIGRDF
ncbi:MAG: hypothetical protein AAGH87_02400 [Pseudomonadota bacterium]